MREEQSIMPKKWTIIIDIVIIALFVFAIFRYREFFIEVYNSIKVVRLETLVQLTLLTVLYVFLEGYIYFAICRMHNPAFTFWDSLSTTLTVAFFRLLSLGTGGMVARVYCYHKRGIRVGDATGAWLLQYLFFKVVILIMGALALLFFPNMLHELPVAVPLVFVGIGIVLFVVGILTVIAVDSRITGFLYRICQKTRLTESKIGHKIEKLFNQMRLLQAEARQVRHEKKLILLVLALNIAMLSTYYLIPSVALHDACDFSMWQGFQVMSLSNLLAGAIPTPSGFGSLELVYYALLTPYNIDAETAGVLVLLRFFTVIVPCLVGGVLWVIDRKKEGRNRKKHRSNSKTESHT